MPMIVCKHSKIAATVNSKNFVAHLKATHVQL
jgi:hypothetical protein